METDVMSLERVARQPIKKSRVIFAAYLALSACASIAFANSGYRFFVYDEGAWLVINAALVLMFFDASFIFYKSPGSRGETLMSLFFPLVSMIHIYGVGVFVDGVDDLFMVLYGWICFFSCFTLSFWNASKLTTKAIFGVLNGALFLLLVLVTFFILALGQFAQNTVVRKITSPDSAYTAVLIDGDAGATGGSTLVNVEYGSVNVLLGELKREKRIYLGRWGESETMTLEWENRDTLLINGTPYKVD